MYLRLPGPKNVVCLLGVTAVRQRPRTDDLWCVRQADLFENTAALLPAVHAIIRRWAGRLGWRDLQVVFVRVSVFPIHR